MIPFFKKASILSEIGWNFNKCGPGIFSTDVTSSSVLNGNDEQRSDTATIPLLLCHLMKGSSLGPSMSTSTVNSHSTNSSASLTAFSPFSAHLNSYGSSNTVIHLRSPNKQKTCTLRAPNPIQAAAWFGAIHTAINSLTSKIINNVNQILIDVLEGSQLKQIGWVHEKVRKLYFNEL